MNFGTYRQYDSRWGSRNYNGSSTYAAAACGPTSCANILHAIDPKITPLTTGKYMQTHGYAIRNNGTAWSGIPACLKAYGAKKVQQVNSMSKVFELCNKGYVGVFLFGAGSRGGVTWTSGGHYISVTDYKVKNNKHYFRTFDSGGRQHDGWYCYETTMKGLIPCIWLCKIPKDKTPEEEKTTYKKTFPTLPERGYFRSGDSGAQVKLLQKFLNWYGDYGLSIDGDLGAKTVTAIKDFEMDMGMSPDGHFGPKSLKKAKKVKK